MAIKILSEDMINKIAAGEVIERPSSVIKETIENSIDAHANKIEINLINSGKEEIIISDNGDGISYDDLKLSVEKHATSKIFTVDDLFSIRTLGFRGEALASINSISHLTIQSRHKESEFGYEFLKGEIKKIGMDVGTKLIIKDLFYNTPARKNYLKGDYIELSHITDIVRKYALCYPKKSFKLTNNQNVILQTTPMSDELANIAMLLDQSLEKHLLPIEFEDDLITVRGYISEPGYLKSNADKIIFFLNDRLVKNGTFYDSLIDAYKSMIFLDQKPAAVIHIYMDPKEYDINVHPRKLDVRFKNETDIYDSLAEAFKLGIKKFNESKQKEINDQVKAIQQELATSVEEIVEEQKVYEPQKLYSIRQQPKDETRQTTIINEPKQTETVKLSFNYKVLDIIDNTYIILKYYSGLYIIDQHALHERILFEKFQHDFEELKGSQLLLSPVIIELSTQGFSKLFANKERVERLGFEFEVFGNNSISLRKIPSAFFDISDKRSLFMNILSDLDLGQIDDENLLKIATKACKSAIKAHDSLTPNQLDQLIDYMFKTDMLTCPHGRPFFIELSKEELEKRFKRS